MARHPPRSAQATWQPTRMSRPYGGRRVVARYGGFAGLHDTSGPDEPQVCRNKGLLCRARARRAMERRLGGSPAGPPFFGWPDPCPASYSARSLAIRSPMRRRAPALINEITHAQSACRIFGCHTWGKVPTSDHACNYRHRHVGDDAAAHVIKLGVRKGMNLGVLGVRDPAPVLQGPSGATAVCCSSVLPGSKPGSPRVSCRTHHWHIQARDGCGSGEFPEAVKGRAPRRTGRWPECLLLRLSFQVLTRSGPPNVQESAPTQAGLHALR